MRKLRRAQAKHARTNRRIQRRILATGAAAAISLTSPAALAQPLRTPVADQHQIGIAQDADRDLLTDREEYALGYLPGQPDQNRTGTVDGVELALRCAQALAQLPSDPNVAAEGGSYKEEMLVFGLETCDVCGEPVNMGVIRVVHPSLGLTVEIPVLAAHYMEHGSFSYTGDVHQGRVEVARLARALGVRFPVEPDDHRLPLDDPAGSPNPVAPHTTDSDGDLLADSEELAAGLSLYDTDQDRDLVPDGIQLARRCAEIIDRLPLADPNAPDQKGVYKISYMMRGLEWCEICGASVNMGYWEIVNPTLGASIQVSEIARHFMEHGSFTHLGTRQSGRVDIAALLEILAWPVQCGDLGTTYPPGDLNQDCKVDIKDFAEWADHWLTSTQPGDK